MRNSLCLIQRKQNSRGMRTRKLPQFKYELPDISFDNSRVSSPGNGIYVYI
ncbi:hypothetical protein SBRY_40057 [Actinacidiphila bryophytorum]|uniref:Uncharacterized protein n=1 Tax=Actinacidiphila bryophytorum TaxID=1436133 RepID=A0A9W4H221_9ACTN|nr:hypothetical protein SBRY_40057 [Actinacidiphila bryophytorum]